MTPLLGRDAAQRTIDTALRQLATGAGSVLFALGEPGAGKTTALDMVAAAVAVDLPSGVVRRARGSRERRSAPGALIIELLPETASFTGDVVTRAVSACESMALTQRPVILVDEVHWSDAPSADALAALAHRATALGILVVFAGRLDPHHERVRQLLALRERLGTDIDLRPLSEEERDRLVHQRFGGRCGPKLRALINLTRGNPLLLVQVLDALEHLERTTSTGQEIDLRDDDIQPFLPDGLAHLIALSVLGREPSEQLLMRAAAVLARGFSTEELAALVDRPVSEALATIVRAVDLGVIVADGDHLAYRHDSVAAAITEHTPPSIVRSLHRQAAVVLEARGADRARVAEHLIRGLEVSDRSDVDRILELGTHLTAELPNAAVELLNAALRVLDVTDPRCTHATIDLARALIASGRLGEATAVVNTAIDVSPEDAAVALLRLRGHLLMLSGNYRLIDSSLGRPVSDDSLLASISHDWDTEAIDGAAELAMGRLFGGEPDAASRWCDALEPLLQNTAGGDAPGYVGLVRSWLLGLDGRYEDALARARSVETLFEPRSAPVTAFSALTLSVMADSAGDSDAALRYLYDIDRSDELRAVEWMRPMLQFNAGVIRFRRGEWDEAMAEVEAGLATAAELGITLGAVWPFAVGALVANLRGDATQADAWLARADQTLETATLGSEWLMWAKARAMRTAGDVSGALILLGLVHDAARELGALSILGIVGPDLAGLAHETGDTSRLRELRSDVDLLRSRSSDPVTAALHDWMSGLADDDPDAVERAADSYATIGRMTESLRARHDAVLACARTGDAVRARRLGNDLLLVYAERQANGETERLRRETKVLRVNLRAGATKARPRTGWASLSETEAAIVEAVASGLTNGTIAERMFLSRRTVEAHLRSVYTKLGMSSRARLIIEARER